jgi:hypothetical protein
MSMRSGVVNDGRVGDRSVQYTRQFSNTTPDFGHIDRCEPDRTCGRSSGRTVPTYVPEPVLPCT